MVWFLVLKTFALHRAPSVFSNWAVSRWAFSTLEQRMQHVRNKNFFENFQGLFEELVRGCLCTSFSLLTLQNNRSMSVNCVFDRFLALTVYFAIISGYY